MCCNPFFFILMFSVLCRKIYYFDYYLFAGFILFLIIQMCLFHCKKLLGSIMNKKPAYGSAVYLLFLLQSPQCTNTGEAEADREKVCQYACTITNNIL